MSQTWEIPYNNTRMLDVVVGGATPDALSHLIKLPQRNYLLSKVLPSNSLFEKVSALLWNLMILCKFLDWLLPMLGPPMD